jgi:hypothetical protein
VDQQDFLLVTHIPVHPLVSFENAFQMDGSRYPNGPTFSRPSCATFPWKDKT